MTERQIGEESASEHGLPGTIFARCMYFSGPNRVEVHDEPIYRGAEGSVPAGQGEAPNSASSGSSPIYVESRIMAISAGSERLFLENQVPPGPLSDSISAISGIAEYPMKYGYANAGIDESGRKVFAFFPHQDRFFCDREELVVLPDALAFDDAVFLAAMETALGIVHDLAPLYGESILVLGQGVIGLMVTEILARSGVGCVVSVDPLEARRAFSAAAGARPLNPDGAGFEDELREAAGIGGFDRAVNVSSSARALQRAIDTVAFEGTIIEASWYGSRSAELNLGRSFHRKRLTIKSSQVSNIAGSIAPRWSKRRRVGTVISLLEAIRPSRFITHRFPLDRAQDAFDIIRRGDTNVLQVVLEP